MLLPLPSCQHTAAVGDACPLFPGAPMQNYGPGYAAAGMPGGDVVNYGGQPAGPPGPQRGGNYNQPVQAQLYHPYRHSPYAARR